MKYHVLHIHTSFVKEWQKDVFDLHICELGVDSIDSEDYYIQSDTWEQNREPIEDLCTFTPEVDLTRVEECPDADWNEAWEADNPVHELPLGIRIVPHCTFGAGHHETTAMMIDELLDHQEHFAKHMIADVLDHGTGTGVLAVFAKKLGALHVTAVDIDDMSVRNAQENAVLNNVDIQALLGDSVPDGQYDLIMANIHRNVLLNNMEAYAVHLTSGGELWLSGFYEADCPVLIACAAEHGLRHIRTRNNGEWRMLAFRLTQN